MLYYSLTLSFVLVAAIFFATRKLGTNWRAAGIAFAAFGLAVVILPGVIFLFSPALVLQAIATCVFAILCGLMDAKPLAIRSLSIASLAVIYGFFGMVALAEHTVLEALRDEFPMTSLTPRLEYEAEAHTLPEPRLAEAVEQRMKEHETEVLADSVVSFQRFTPRNHSLFMLHEVHRNSFVNAQGFGFQRMPRFVDREEIALPPIEPVTLPPPSYVPEVSPDQAAESPLAAAKMPAQEALQTLHRVGQKDFLEPERMGYVRDREHVAGFVGHGFSQTPTVHKDADEYEQWQLVKLELVSLLKHVEPVAYVSEVLPQMDRLQDVPTRPLDPFERQAIQQLRADKDLVVDAQPARVRMVGSLRATNDCRACHQVPRGTLLGAFTYELLPAVPRATTTPELPKA